MRGHTHSWAPVWTKCAATIFPPAFAEALDAVVEREVAERAPQERGRVVVIGSGGKLALLAEDVEVLKDREERALPPLSRHQHRWRPLDLLL